MQEIFHLRSKGTDRRNALLREQALNYSNSASLLRGPGVCMKDKIQYRTLTTSFVTDAVFTTAKGQMERNLYGQMHLRRSY